MLVLVPSLCLSAQTDANSGASVEYKKDIDARAEKKAKKADALTLKQVVRKYKEYKKADYMKIDGFLLSIAKAGMKADDEMPAEAVDALKSMILLSLDDCKFEIKQAFRGEMADALAGCEMILEANDEEDNVGIYVGRMDENYFEDFIIYESDDCDLMIMQGKFPISALQRMIDENKD